MLLYYSRKYAVYCFTVYESITQNGYCYIWGESDGGRASNDIGSCLYNYLKLVDSRGVKKLILYCDSCAGQNKNKTILSILRYFLSKSINLETIQINYLLSGHTYMPVDSMHATIEREVRKLIVWAPSQWPTFIESARKNPRPYQVEVMEHNDFIDFDGVLFTTAVALRMRQIKIVTFKKKSKNTLAAKYSMDPDSQTVIINIDTESTGSTQKWKETRLNKEKTQNTSKRNESLDRASTRNMANFAKNKGKGNNTKDKEELKRASTRTTSNENLISGKGKGIGKKTKIKEEFDYTTKEQSEKGKGRGKITKGKEELKRAITRNRNLPGKSKSKGRGIGTDGPEELDQPSTSKNEQQSTKKHEQPDIKPLYKERLKIAYQKYTDLKRLCDNGSIPRRFHLEYMSLPYSKKIVSALAETDEEDEVDVEEEDEMDVEEEE